MNLVYWANADIHIKVKQPNGRSIITILTKASNLVISNMLRMRM